jgi:pectinesterase
LLQDEIDSGAFSVGLSSSIRAFSLLSVVTLAGAGLAMAEAVTVQMFPANKAKGVNPDTHLVLTFLNAPTIGKSGQVRIYDAAEHSLVDTLDLSIPAGPDPSRRVASPQVPVSASTPLSPTTTTPAVRTIPADLYNYQLATIGGLEDFHFYPVIVHDNVATIYPHSHVLKYGHKYIVQIDAGVLSIGPTAFLGMSTDRSWTFTTKSAPPDAGVAKVVVAADGSGDFNTIQGAVDFVPDNPARRMSIFIKNGTYEEIVFFRDKANLTIRGEDREKVQIGYGNNSGFNPPMPGPSRRCAFSAYNSTGIELFNFSVSNYFYGQAEGLLVSGSKNIVSHVNIKGSGDALNLRGSVYLTDCKITGDGDTILGVGPAFFNHCELESIGPFMWIRNTNANHGNVFVDCIFTAMNRPLPWTLTAAIPTGENAQAATTGSTAPNAATEGNAPVRPRVAAVLARLPNNHGLNYPYAEAVLINCHLKGIPPIGWGPIDDDTTHMHLWEFNSTGSDGHAIDISQRHPVSKQLTMPQDAETIANYSNPAFVLGGWTPVVEQ